MRLHRFARDTVSRGAISNYHNDDFIRLFCEIAGRGIRGDASLPLPGKHGEQRGNMRILKFPGIVAV